MQKFVILAAFMLVWLFRALGISRTVHLLESLAVPFAGWAAAAVLIALSSRTERRQTRHRHLPSTGALPASRET